MASKSVSLVTFQSIEALENRLSRIESLLFGNNNSTSIEGKDFLSRLESISNNLNNLETTYFSQSSSSSCISIYKKLKPLFNSNTSNFNLTNVLSSILTNISTIQLQVETVNNTAKQLLNLRLQLEDVQKLNSSLPIISKDEEEYLIKCLDLVEEILPQVYTQSKDIDELIDLYEKGLKIMNATFQANQIH